MTLPYERTRAVVQAGEFLLELSRDTSCPEPVRMRAKQLLRHYPSRRGLLLAGEIEEHLCAGTAFEPYFSSKDQG